MAALALTPVLPEVHVILRVAGNAIRTELHLVGRLPVAVRAHELRVRAGERESGLLAVVEFPNAPAVRRVTPGAFLPQSPFVDIVLLVTLDAFVAHVFVLARDVALLARHRDMQAHEREFRQVVVEAHPGAPALGRMTLSAVRAELAEVHIAGAMAGDAVFRQLLGCHDRGVTGMTVDLLMAPDQLPVPVARVIE